MDPLSSLNSHASPYSFTLNNPLMLIDQHGLTEEDPLGAGYKNEAGQYIWIDNQNVNSFTDESGISWTKVTDNKSNWDEATTIRDANIQALVDLGHERAQVEKDVQLYDADNPLFTKLSRLENSDNYTGSWDSAFNSESLSWSAKSSGLIGDSGFELKFYPDKKGGQQNPRALGLARNDFIEHSVEAVFEYLEYKLNATNRNNGAEIQDDNLIDMHYDNSIEYLKKK